jgi:hypothetical protein
MWLTSICVDLGGRGHIRWINEPAAIGYLRVFDNHKGFRIALLGPFGTDAGNRQVGNSRMYVA